MHTRLSEAKQSIADNRTFITRRLSAREALTKKAYSCPRYPSVSGDGGTKIGGIATEITTKGLSSIFAPF